MAFGEIRIIKGRIILWMHAASASGAEVKIFIGVITAVRAVSPG